MKRQTLIAISLIGILIIVIAVVIYYANSRRPPPPPPPKPVPPTPIGPGPNVMSFFAGSSTPETYECVLTASGVPLDYFQFDIKTTRYNCYVAGLNLTTTTTGSFIDFTLGESGSLVIDADVDVARYRMLTPPQRTLNDAAWHRVKFDATVSGAILVTIDDAPTISILTALTSPFPSRSVTLAHRAAAANDASSLEPFNGCLNDVFAVDSNGQRYAINSATCAGGSASRIPNSCPTIMPSRSALTFAATSGYLRTPSGHVNLAPSDDYKLSISFCMRGATKPKSFVMAVYESDEEYFALYVDAKGSIAFVATGTDGRHYDTSTESMDTPVVVDGQWHWFALNVPTNRSLTLQTDETITTYANIDFPSVRSSPLLIGNRPAQQLVALGSQFIGCIKDIRLTDAFVVSLDNSQQVGSIVTAGC